MIRSWRFVLIPLALLALCHRGLAQDVEGRVNALVRAAGLGKTDISLYAVDLETGRVLFRNDQDEPMMPASNLKLVVSAAAIHTLGADFNFETRFVLLNPPRAEGDAVNDAVLLVRGDGDPSFGDEVVLRQYGGKVDDAEALLTLWVEMAKKANIRSVARLIVDDGVFDQTFVHPSWPADQLNRWYCAEVAGLNFFTNCLDVYPSPAAAGESPLVTVLPEAPFVSRINLATTGGADTFWISRKLNTNEITFRGSVKHKRTKPVNVTIHDPPMFFGHLLADRLGKAGIAVAAVTRPKPSDVLDGGKALHLVRTPLSVVLARCNKNSQNLYAECLFKRIGRQITGAPGSFDNGAAAVRLFLQKKVGTGAASVNTADGSGLSRDNRVTARLMVEILAAMNKDAKVAKLYRSSMSIAGADGTLDDRLKGLSGRVYGKTGYISGVSCLSGYLVAGRKGAAANRPANPAAGDDADDGPAVAFSLLFNDLKAPLDSVMRLQDNIVKVIDEGYAK